MKNILLAILMAMVVEALIEYAKNLIKMFTDKDYKTAITQLCAVLVSVLLCMAACVDMFAALDITFNVSWLGVILTGILISRGANYVSDFIKRLQTVKGGA